MIFFGDFELDLITTDNNWSSIETTSNITLSDNDLTATSSADNQQVEIESVLPDGRSYFEVEIVTNTSTTSSTVGVARVSYDATSPGLLGFSADAGSGGYTSNGAFRISGAVTGGKTPWGGGDVIMVARDKTNGRVWFGVNGVWDGDPAAGTGQAGVLNVGLDMHGIIFLKGLGSEFKLVPDAASQTYPAPTGFTAIG